MTVSTSAAGLMYSQTLYVVPTGMTGQITLAVELFYLLPVHCVRQHIIPYLSIKSLVRLDTACVAHERRSAFLQIVSSSVLAVRSTIISESGAYALEWLHRRKIALYDLSVLLDRGEASFPRFLAFPCQTRELCVHIAAREASAQPTNEMYFEHYLQVERLRLNAIHPQSVIAFQILLIWN